MKYNWQWVKDHAKRRNDKALQAWVLGREKEFRKIYDNCVYYIDGIDVFIKREILGE